MAKIRKIYDETIKPNGEKTVIYPITSTRAVYTPNSVTIDSLLNEGYRFGGVALPTDSPSITDQRVFYGASVPGTYTNFGGINVDGGEAIFLMWDGAEWHKGIFGGAGSSNLTGFKSLTYISELPLEPTMIGYLIGDYMYVWVGENGDTLQGKYQNVGQLRGASAYEVAVRNGYEGTEQQWLNDPIHGIKGVSVASVAEVGTHSTENSAENTYRITLTNNESLDMKVKNGKGINSVAVVGGYSTVDGAENTYRITLSDNTTFEFKVRNGSQGNTGSSVAYPFELLNVLNSTATDKGVTALKVKELNESVTHIGTTLNSTDTNIKHISDFEGTPINPVTHERGVLDDDGISIEPKLQQAADVNHALMSDTLYNAEVIATWQKYSYMIVSDGNWGTSTSNKHLRLYAYPGTVIYITANATNAAAVAMLKTNAVTPGGTPDYATGWTNRVLVDAGKTGRFVVPDDATRIYIYAGTESGGYASAPASITVRSAKESEELKRLSEDTRAYSFIELTPSSIENNKMFNASGNIITESSINLYKYAVTPGNKYLFSGRRQSTSAVYLLAWYDENENYISHAFYGSVFYYTDELQTAPANAAYAFINVQKILEETYNVRAVSEVVKGQETSERVDMLYGYSANNGKFSQIRVTPTIVDSYRVRGDTGVIEEASSQKMAAIAVSGASSIRFLGFEPPFGDFLSGYAFYDGQDECIYSRKWVVGNTFKEREYMVSVPEGAVTFRTTLRMSSAISGATYVTEEDFYVYRCFGKNQMQQIDRCLETANKVGADSVGMTVIPIEKITDYELVKSGYKLLNTNGSLYSAASFAQDSDHKIYKIPCAGYKRVEMYIFESDAYGHAIFNSDDIKVASCRKTAGGIYNIEIPYDAAYILYDYLESPDNNTDIILYSEGGLNTKDEANGVAIDRDILGLDRRYNRASWDLDVFTIYGQSQYKFGSASRGTALSDITINKEANTTNYLIPLDGYSSVTLFQFGTSSSYGSAFLDEELRLVRSITRSPAGEITVDVPSGAQYLFYSAISLATSFVSLHPYNAITNHIAALEEKVDNVTENGIPLITKTGAAPKMESGKLASDGSLTENSAYVTTVPVFGNFYLALNAGYVIHSASYVDESWKVVSHEHMYPVADPSETFDFWSWRTQPSLSNMPAKYGYRFVICKTDGSDIDPKEDIIKKFVSMTDAGLHRWIPEDLPKYDVAQRRIAYMQRALWTPLAKVPDGSSVNSVTNTYYCLPGQKQMNLPYSDLGLTRKFVPANVSMRTFLTATKNKRSLFYTENLFNNTSKYDKTYSNASRCGSYYGCACNAFTGWVAGFKTLGQTWVYRDNLFEGMSTVANATHANVRPLDFIWNDGHISMISDIWKDDFGNVQFICWAEMTTPHAKMTLYSPEEFDARLVGRSCVVHRWTGWNSIEEPPTIPGYNAYLLGGTEAGEDIPYNPDIMCFAGDYAAFASGEKVVLNCRRASTYTGVELYKDDAVEPTQTIDISEMEVDGIYTDDEDWVAVNLGTSLAAGKYKARMTDGTNFTDYTYFQVIGITASASQSGGNLTVTFSCTGGTPISLEKCSNAGFQNAVHTITDAEVSAGSVTEEWEYESRAPKLYLLVKGDYGTVVKILTYPH